jgi:putative ABC transport system permease protein
MAPKTPNFDFGMPLPKSKLWQAKGTPGVEWAEPYRVFFSFWKTPDGRRENVCVVGFDPRKKLGGPWEMVEGNVTDLLIPEAILIDEAEKSKLGVTGIGDLVEINGKSSRVVGFTKGVRSFHTAPYVFTTTENAERYEVLALNEPQLEFILVKAQPGVSVEELRTRLQNIPETEVLTGAEFARRSQMYWLIQTGVGAGFALAALMGFFVGLAVVAQTFYASVLEKMREFGTLKALGWTNRMLARIVIEQALWVAVVGWLTGLAISKGISWAAAEFLALNLVFSGGVAVVCAVCTLLVCLGAALLPINSIRKAEPALAFRM